MLAIAILSMFAALGFYTYAVFNGRRHGLAYRHLAAFGLGLAFDFYGTHLMNNLIKIYGEAPQWHNISGFISLWGMALHFALALVAAVFGGSAFANKAFHKVSLSIYTLWVFAFISGMLAGMHKAGMF